VVVVDVDFHVVDEVVVVVVEADGVASGVLGSSSGGVLLFWHAASGLCEGEAVRWKLPCAVWDQECERGVQREGELGKTDFQCKDLTAESP
jgi:hypothetical protein